MNLNGLVEAIVEKCRIYYDGELVSETSLVQNYLTYFAKQLEDPEERKIGFTFHTGSKCFDVASLAAIMLGCFAYDMSTNDDIISSFKAGDWVLYNNSRYRWGGIITCTSATGQEVKTVNLFQDSPLGTSKVKTSFNLEEKKHLIKPYNGKSKITDGRGIRKTTNNRNDFLSYVLGCSVKEVPSTLGISFVIIADKMEFTEICNKLSIAYGYENKRIKLTDVIPVAYYSSSLEPVQIGNNPSKQEAVIKFTNKVSTARELVYDKSGNKVVGLFALTDTLEVDSSEVDALLKRKALKFIHISMPYKQRSCEYAIEQYEDASLFACTKDTLYKLPRSMKYCNRLSIELTKQIDNIVSKEIEFHQIGGFCNWDEFNSLKRAFFAIRNSDWDNRDEFLIKAGGLLKLFTTSFFPIGLMEGCLDQGKIKASVRYPVECLAELEEMAENESECREAALHIYNSLNGMYYKLYEDNPKVEKLLELLVKNPKAKVALIISKAFYADIFNEFYKEPWELANVECFTPKRFDPRKNYDWIIAFGDVVDKRFDSLDCYAAPKISLLLYDYECKAFLSRKKKYAKVERKINAKIRGEVGRDDELNGSSFQTGQDDIVLNNESEQITELDSFLEELRIKTFRNNLMKYMPESNLQSEVTHVGFFDSGEQILFSKYYSATVFDEATGQVTEKSPDKLEVGDVLVFIRKDEQARNMVDYIWELIASSGNIPEEISRASSKAQYWKSTLRSYKTQNDLGYRELTKKLNGIGKLKGYSTQEVTIRQWLNEESHIIGPQKLEAFYTIASLTQDEQLLNDPEGFDSACKDVRHYRRQLLKLIARAITDKLCNNDPGTDALYNIIYDCVDELSMMLELDNIEELEDVKMFASYCVNKPINPNDDVM